jgi:diaminopropionate ammonia-lyase
MFLNPRRRDDDRGMFTRGEYESVARFFDGREATPLRDLTIDSRRVLVKDESSRFGLNAFKVAGVEYAMAKRNIAPGTAIACASAGNFGRAVAHVGRRMDLRVRVYMSSATAAAPRSAIESEGAEVVIVDGTYDDAVRRMRDDGALVVSDTAWPGNEEIPRDIMLGYTRIMDEAREQWPVVPDIVLVQAGVGGLAAAVVSWLRDRYVDAFTICVEPASANPLMLSAEAGHIVEVTTPMSTIMAGLRCAEASSIAVQPLIDGCDAFMTISDDETREAMRVLASRDIVAGPSGAAGFAAWRKLERDGVALVINTEGATDRTLYESIVAQ